MKRWLIVILVFLCIVPLSLASARSFSGPEPRDGTPTPEPDSIFLAEEVDDLKQAIRQAITVEEKAARATFVLFEQEIANLSITRDSQWGKAWLEIRDPVTGENLPTEPGLVLSYKSGGTWRVVLPGDQNWTSALEDVPVELVSEEEKEYWRLLAVEEVGLVPDAPLGGYLLPWPAGLSHNLTQSINHDLTSVPSGNAHFSFDFAVPRQMWDIYASKGGVVWMYRDDIPNGATTSPGNYIVLQDPTTNPVTYQLYLHLAENSIPAGLKQRGAVVAQGQFIGVADDTGASTGHHLHFHVHTDPTSFWSYAVDITFADVAINGGRPRAPHEESYCYQSDNFCDAFQYAYVSGNSVATSLNLPGASLASPYPEDTIQSGTVIVGGRAWGNGAAVDNIRLVANYGDAWHEIGPVYYSSPFAYSWDMCAAGVPDGPVSIAARVTDVNGKVNLMAGLTHIIKDYTCPAPGPCQPSSTQVALYESVSYDGCGLFGVGDYADNLLPVGDGDAESIRVGASVKATLYDHDNYTGRGETFTGGDRNLTDDWIGANTVSSIQVRLLTEKPAKPILRSPAQGAAHPNRDVLTLFWENGGGATEYQVLIDGPESADYLSDWLAAPVFHYEYDNLPLGGYTWWVRGRSGVTEGEWSAASAFTVVDGASSQTSYLSPKLFSLEESTTPTDWKATGLWRWVNSSSSSFSSSHAWWYQSSSGTYEVSGSAIAGTLTSPFITIPTTGYYLRFRYRYETESAGDRWDQRWVQIAVDDQPFRNVLQLKDDLSMNDTENWLLSPAIDLSAYSGHKIRVRFYFNSLDGKYNAYRGWGIDNVEINTTPPDSCSDPYESNNTPETATPIQYGNRLTGLDICPQGDIDYFKFTGARGDPVVVDINARVDGSVLDSLVYLLDRDGRTVLAAHDDEVYGVLQDSHLSFILPENGDYYLKVMPWNYPSGSDDFTYSLYFLKDAKDPAIAFDYPQSRSALVVGRDSISVLVSDAGSGVSQVDFYYHPNSWYDPVWRFLGSDTDGADGWSALFSPDSQAEGNGYAFAARAYDWAGNALTAAAWEVSVDRSAPTSAMLPLPDVQGSTAFWVSWTGSDALSGIGYYDLQWTDNGGATWQNYPEPLLNSGAWFIGQIGKTYGFRVRAVDQAGNQESFPSAVEDSTSIPLNVCSAADSFESDNSAGAAKGITPDGQAHDHNFCNPTASDWLNDEDWVSVSVEAGKYYRVIAYPLSDSFGATLSLYGGSPAALTLLGESSSARFGSSAPLIWKADRTGIIYLQVKHLDGRVAGDDVKYRLWVKEGFDAYLPWINK